MPLGRLLEIMFKGTCENGWALRRVAICNASAAKKMLEARLRQLKDSAIVYAQAS